MDEDRFVAYDRAEQKGESRHSSGIAFNHGDGINENDYIGISDHALDSTFHYLIGIIYHEAAHHKYDVWHDKRISDFNPQSSDEEGVFSQKFFDEIVFSKDTPYLYGLWIDSASYGIEMIEARAEELMNWYMHEDIIINAQGARMKNRKLIAPLNKLLEEYSQVAEELLFRSRENFVEDYKEYVFDDSLFQSFFITDEDLKKALTESSLYEYYQERMREAEKIGRENLEI